MTREEAIATLETAEYELSNQVGSKYCQKKYEAVKMAIKALEQEPCEDTISRQAAIDALSTITMYEGSIPFDTAVMRIEQLPSAQPATIRCKDCKHRREDECPMYHVEWVEYDDDGYIESDDVIYDYTEDDGYCHMAERRTDE